MALGIAIVLSDIWSSSRFADMAVVCNLIHLPLLFTSLKRFTKGLAYSALDTIYLMTWLPVVLLRDYVLVQAACQDLALGASVRALTLTLIAAAFLIMDLYWTPWRRYLCTRLLF